MADRKEYKKQYREEHKEQIKQWHAEYFQLNKDEITAKQKQYRHEKQNYLLGKIACDICGACVCRKAMPRHKRTNKCINHDK